MSCTSTGVISHFPRGAVQAEAPGWVVRPTDASTAPVNRSVRRERPRPYPRPRLHQTSRQLAAALKSDWRIEAKASQSHMDQATPYATPVNINLDGQLQHPVNHQLELLQCLSAAW